jgi:DNA-binding transcriptional regulator YhcF (GntR family)
MAHINPALNLRDGVFGDQGAGAAIPKKEGARANLRDRIYTQIIDSIVQDEFPEQSRLPTEVELAERFGASRPTVREALSRLRSDGVIASRRGSGSYVVRKPDVNLLRLTSIESIADIQRCFVFRDAHPARSRCDRSGVHGHREGAGGGGSRGRGGSEIPRRDRESVSQPVLRFGD